MIVILLILAGITIATLGGENGLFARAKQAKEETQKETATEQINLVISDVYVKSYTEKQEEPTLQDIADGFCNAEGTEYVDIQTRNVSTLETVDITGYTAIYVKLEKYPYEFKIDDTLKIASIDGVEVSSTTGNTNNGDISSGEADSSDSTNNNSNFENSEEYKSMQETIAQLQEEVSNLKASQEDEKDWRIVSGTVGCSGKQYAKDDTNLGNMSIGTNLSFTTLTQDGESTFWFNNITTGLSYIKMLTVQINGEVMFTNASGVVARPCNVSFGNLYKLRWNMDSWVKDNL